MRNRAVFLDRDGVSNRAVVVGGKPHPPQRLEEVEVVPEAAEVLGALKARGFLLIVVSNQPDVSRGTQTREQVGADRGLAVHNFTHWPFFDVASSLKGGYPAYVSVFAGRIADTGQDPVPLMAAAVEMLVPFQNVELIWASPRELLNVFQADAIGCDIITATSDILKKLELVGKDLAEYSLETVQMFYNDAVSSGFVL